MLIFLDTKDLIDILENARPVSAQQLGDCLSYLDAQLALSFAVIAELAAPLTKRNASTNVMSLLNRLEELPHLFIAESQVQILELREAVNAFSEAREYQPIDPFVSRFDYVLQDPPATAAFLHHSLAETVFALWTTSPSLFDGFAGHWPMYNRLLLADRSLSAPPRLSAFFPAVVDRALRAYGIELGGVNLTSFANWIYASPSRCPSTSLLFEAWHRVRRNKGDLPKRSDLSDFAHLLTLPYVDLATLDRRMVGYVRQIAYLSRPLARRYPNAGDLLEDSIGRI